MIKKPHVDISAIKTLYDNRFLKVYGLEYTKDKPYMNASRRSKDDLVAIKSDKDFKEMLPDAVSCIVIINGVEPKLLLTYEFRYPTGQFLLSVPAGLIDSKDKEGDNPIIETAIRELKEEANISLKPNDRIEIVNPLLFSTPGMTDESNALVLVTIADGSELHLNQEGAEGTECFNGFVEITRKDAQRLLKQGRDDNGVFYSIYTWAALMYFIGQMD